MKIPFNKLNLQYEAVKDSLTLSLDKLFLSSDYINGKKVAEFEVDFANYIGTKYAIGVSNGTDALKLAAKSLDLQGSTVVFIPANTFISTILGIEEALPAVKFEIIDCNDDYLIDITRLESRLKELRDNYKNAIIVPVHLYGRTCDMVKIVSLSKQYRCKLIEDASQSHGSTDQNGIKTGNLSDVSCFSLYPGKNLGAFGDAGVITTNSEQTTNSLKKLRNLGSDKKYQHEIKGYNHRLDSLQACVLVEKLKFLDKWNDSRVKAANKYLSNITNPNIVLPRITTFENEHVYHIFCIRHKNRTGLIEYLNNNGIETGIHYPILIEEMNMYKNLGFYSQNARQFSREIVSLPIHPFMTEEEIDHVCEKLNNYE